MKIKKLFLATIVAPAILAFDGAIAQAAMFVTTAPPPPRSMGVIGRSPGRGFVWTDGYWRWAGDAGDTSGCPADGNARLGPVRYGLDRGGGVVVAATPSLRAAGVEVGRWR